MMCAECFAIRTPVSSWSSSVHSAVLWSLPQVPQTMGFRMLLLDGGLLKIDSLGISLVPFSFFLSRLVYPMMIRPSLIAWLAALGDLSLTIRWAVHFPATLLVVGLNSIP